MYKFVSRIPIRTIVYLIAGWIFLSLLNFIFIKAGFYEDVPIWFPISVFIGPTIHLYGIPYLFLFLGILAFAIRFAPKLTIYHVWLIGLSLIILGNLGQGNWDSAFIKPVDGWGIQYYHDAIKITSWSEWLESFNIKQQTSLLDGHTFASHHSRIHPPFAVLIHYFVLKMLGNNLTFLSMMFVFISSLSILIVWHIFRILCVPLENRNLLALLFSVIPAVNIYSAVCLDGLILSSATLFLLGLIIILKSERISMTGLLAITFGMIITNLLTYLGVFLIAVAGIQAFKEFMLNRRFNISVSLLISIGIFLAVAIALSIYGYNHIQGFLNASLLENPNGFRGWHEPLTYLATRVECMSEIALFLSFGFLAILFHPNKLGISYSDWRNIEIGIFLSGVIILIAMFISGAFWTGETARGGLFIYPYFILALRNSDSMMLKDILKFAGIQTIAMQLFGNYFW